MQKSFATFEEALSCLRQIAYAFCLRTAEKMEYFLFLIDDDDDDDDDDGDGNAESSLSLSLLSSSLMMMVMIMIKPFTVCHPSSQGSSWMAMKGKSIKCLNKFITILN